MGECRWSFADWVAASRAHCSSAEQLLAVDARPERDLNISLPLAAMGNVLQQGVLVLQLENVTNADLSAEQGTPVLSQSCLRRTSQWC